jgi:hypothetical protein
MKDKALPVGTLLRLWDAEFTYSVIVLDSFPVIFSGEQMRYYSLHFFRNGINMGVLAFSENELKELLITGEAEVLSEGTNNEA